MCISLSLSLYIYIYIYIYMGDYHLSRAFLDRDRRQFWRIDRTKTGLVRTGGAIAVAYGLDRQESLQHLS